MAPRFVISQAVQRFEHSKIYLSYWVSILEIRANFSSTRTTVKVQKQMNNDK
uniref:Uncharacterized protein n=1 Tax=Rhizophora mucronata TaxID=61149 RepID=A0A2P2PPS6_RHIMU